MKKIFILFWLAFLTNSFSAQVDSAYKFEVNYEYRSRAEYRDGYQVALPSQFTNPAYFISHRNRITLNYEESKFKINTSLQDIRVWGQNGTSSTLNTLGVFEANVEAKLSKYFRLKIGRQALELDNGRLFSRANWNQASRAHDGIRINYKKNNVSSEVFSAFNQSKISSSGTNYNFGNSIYKMLIVHYLEIQLNKKLSFLTINATDAFESDLNANIIYLRGTSGGRISYKHKKINTTINSFYQYGQLQNGKAISSYYFQPEVSHEHGKTTATIGLEIASGTKESKIDKSNTFSTLYGVSFKFMGNLNYFTNISKDTKDYGLKNPYLTIDYKLNKKTKLRLTSHVFYLDKKAHDENHVEIGPYLGFEQDVKIKRNINSYSFIDLGFSYLKANKSMEFLKTGDSRRIPVFSYLMFTFKPQLYSVKQKKSL